MFCRQPSTLFSPRAPAKDAIADLSSHPRSLIQSKLGTAWLHAFAMEIKGHVPWIAAMLATAVLGSSPALKDEFATDGCCCYAIRRLRHPAGASTLRSGEPRMTGPIIQDSTTSTSPGTSIPIDIRDGITSGNAAFIAAFGSGDAAAVARCYSAEGQLLPPNADMISGHSAIEAFWSEAMRLGIAAAALETAEIYYASGDRTATEVGRYTLTTADGQPADRGKYIVIWEREKDGRCRIHRDIWNSSLPAPLSA
jgi:ketosteroid isomerase-like protein